MELLFINKNFHYVRVVPVKNGCGWSVDALAKQIDTFFRAMNFGGDHVVIWLDRENRADTSPDMAAALKQVIVDAGFPQDRVAVLVCDRMTENLILSDETFVREEFEDPAYEYLHEGLGGKHILRTKFEQKQITYRETVHGVACLKKIRLSRCSAASPSAAAFLEALPFECWWF